MENEYKNEINLNLALLKKIASVCAANPATVLSDLSIPRNTLEVKGSIDITTVDSRLKILSSNGVFDYGHVGRKNYLFNSIDKTKLAKEIDSFERKNRIKHNPSTFLIKKIQLDDINKKLILNDTEYIGFYDKKNYDIHKHYVAADLLFTNRTEIKRDKITRNGAYVSKRSLMNVCGCKTADSFYQIMRRLRSALKKYPIEIKRIGSSYCMEITLS